VNIYIAHYHFQEISSALNALSVHLKQKWFKETFKKVQIECVIIQVRRETVPSWRASEREGPSASCNERQVVHGQQNADDDGQATTRSASTSPARLGPILHRYWDTATYWPKKSQILPTPII